MLQIVQGEEAVIEDQEKECYILRPKTYFGRGLHIFKKINFNKVYHFRVCFGRFGNEKIKLLDF